MANYEFAVASNDYVKVKDVNEVASVFGALGYDEVYTENNSVFIGSYNANLNDDDEVIINKETGKVEAVKSYYSDEVCDLDCNKVDDESIFDDETKYRTISSMQYLQEQLLDDEIVAITEVGAEKLVSVGACVVVISKEGIFWNSTDGFINDTTKKIQQMRKEKENEKEVNS